MTKVISSVLNLNDYAISLLNSIIKSTKKFMIVHIFNNINI
ncbi:unknown [Prevotella sp. CAG:1124]|nr:unknown [Prevotella sp. CAG:1124]